MQKKKYIYKKYIKNKTEKYAAGCSLDRRHAALQRSRCLSFLFSFAAILFYFYFFGVLLVILVRLKLHFISATLQNIYLLSWFVEYLPSHKELATGEQANWQMPGRRKSLRKDDDVEETKSFPTEAFDCFWTCMPHT